MPRDRELIERAIDAACKPDTSSLDRMLVRKGMEMAHMLRGGAEYDLEQAEKEVQERNDGHFIHSMASALDAMVDAGGVVYQYTKTTDNPMYRELVERYRRIAMSAASRCDFSPRQYPDEFDVEFYYVVAKGPGETPCPHDGHTISEKMQVIHCVDDLNRNENDNPYRLMPYAKWLDGFDPLYALENVLPSRLAQDINICG